MSVVAAKVCGDIKEIRMAADSIIINGYTKDTKGDFAKIRESNGMIIGSVGWAEESSFMWHFMDTHKPATPTDKDVLEFMIEFADYQKSKTGSFGIKNSYMIAFDGHLFKADGLFVYEVHNFGAIGAGEDYALAALHLGHSPSTAVKVACDLSCLVSEPVIEYSMAMRDMKSNE